MPQRQDFRTQFSDVDSRSLGACVREDGAFARFLPGRARYSSVFPQWVELSQRAAHSAYALVPHENTCHEIVPEP